MVGFLVLLLSLLLLVVMVMMVVLVCWCWYCCCCWPCFPGTNFLVFFPVKFYSILFFKLNTWEIIISAGLYFGILCYGSMLTIAVLAIFFLPGFGGVKITWEDTTRKPTRNWKFAHGPNKPSCPPRKSTDGPNKPYRTSSAISHSAFNFTVVQF